MKYGGCIYIMSNHNNTVLYIGVTSDLYARVAEHKEKKYAGSFTAKYNCNKLVYYESYGRIEETIAREKQLKKLKREWKQKPVHKMNPGRKDLFDTL